LRQLKLIMGMVVLGTVGGLVLMALDIQPWVNSMGGAMTLSGMFIWAYLSYVITAITQNEEKWQRCDRVISGMKGHIFDGTRELPSECCPICLGDWEPQDSIKFTPCGHAFHEECLGEWMQHKLRCALCRQDLAPLAYKKQEAID
jgi:hypothetical protein